MKPKAVRKLDKAKLCTTPMESLPRQHLNSVLNTASVSSDIRYDLVDAHLFSLDEIREVLSLVAGIKAGGINGILPETVRVCSDELLTHFLSCLLVFGIVGVFCRSREMSL